MEKINENPFIIKEGVGKKVPLIISIPHSGIDFPESLVDNYIPEQIKSVDDTDWFIDQLYDFATEMGITVIKAKYSRWVIDLNRDPESKPLYSDGRVITGLTSTTDFLGNPIYKAGKEPNQTDIEERLKKYYWPYYAKITSLLDDRIAEFGKVILWDAHSIRESVPSIRKENFPEMILGNVDQTSADKKWINIALNELRKTYQVSHNDPFKGGHITRCFGNPTKNIHALQLERSKKLYMDDTELIYDDNRANKMKIVLKNTLTALLNSFETI